MNKFNDFYKKIDESVKFWSAIVGTMCVVYVGFFRFFGSYIPSEYHQLFQWLIIYLIATATINVVCQYIRKAKNVRTLNLATSVEKWEDYRFDLIYRKVAACLQGVFLLGIAIFPFLFYLTASKIDGRCKVDATQFSITINKFSVSDPDPFSSSLANYLTYHKSSGTSVDMTERLFVNKNSNVLKDSLVALLGCHQQGMVVYGNHDELSKSFYCNLYLHNMFGKCRSVSVGDTTIAIQDPKLIEIQTNELRVQMIGKFIQSLCLSTDCEEKTSILLLNELINDSYTQNCKQLLANCYLIKGNNQARLNMVDSAIVSYSEGLRYNHSDNLLLNNFKILSATQKSHISHKTKIVHTASASLSNHIFLKTAKSNVKIISVFTGGTMKIVYPTKLLNSNMIYELNFSINNRVYKFGGSQATHV